MAQTKRAGWVALVTLSVTLASTHAIPAQEAAAAPTPKKTPFDDGSAQDGATKSAVCTACHGANGNSTNAEWPVLAGQNAAYIDQQLKLFRAGVRNNPVMMPMAAALSDKDISDLAVYFSAQVPTGGEADPSYWKAGEALYRGGDVTRNIPACVACHGPVGRGNVAAGYPALRAQHSVYTVKQLTDYSSGARYGGATADKDKQPGPNSAMMATIAKRLTPEDIRNVASYIQGMR
jgi:cytochrome c553